MGLPACPSERNGQSEYSSDILATPPISLRTSPATPHYLYL